MRINLKNIFFLFIIPSILAGTGALFGFLLAILATKPGCEAGEKAAPKLNCTFDESACEDLYADYFYNCTTEENKHQLTDIMDQADDKLIFPYVMIGMAIGFLSGWVLEFCCCFNVIFKNKHNSNESTYLLAPPDKKKTVLNEIFHKIKFFCCYSDSNHVELEEKTSTHSS